MGHLGMVVEWDGGTVLPFARQGAVYRRAPAAFTLVELLAVILIVGMLAAILTPVVMQSLTKARNTAIKAEIDMLHMAIMNYKNQHGSFPPCFLGLTDNVTDSNRLVTRNHLKRLFPRINAALNGEPDYGASVMNVVNNLVPQTNDPARSLVFWLRGFTSNPTLPLTPDNARVKLYDFDQARITSTGMYHISGKPEATYTYLNAALYNNVAIPTASDFTPPNPIPIFVHVYPDRVLANGVPRSIPAWVASLSSEQRELWFFTVSPDPAERPHQRIFNPESFQLLNPGRDGEFGTGDDLSNFWPGTRRDYLDSLKK